MRALASRSLVRPRTVVSARCYSDEGYSSKSSGLARATIIGNVGQDIKVIQHDGEKSSAYFSLATTSVNKSPRTGEMSSRTDWFQVVCHQSKVVETLERVVKKGATLYVEGPLELRESTDSAGVLRRSATIKIQGYTNFRVLKWPKEADDSAHHGDGSHGGGGGGRQRGVFGAEGQVYD